MKHAAILLCLSLCACGGRENAASNQAVDRPAAPTPAPTPPPATTVRVDPNAELDIRSMLDRIYAPYASANAPGIDLSLYLEPQLAEAMHRGQRGVNADPFLDAQDYEPFRPTFGPLRVEGERAQIDVQIRSMGQRTIHYDFVRTPAGWRIADIVGPTGGSLRAHFGFTPLS